MRALQFSGGKDSLACLRLYENELDDIVVCWIDTGDSFPETINQMEKVKRFCPNFVIVKGNQPENIKQFGYPVDVLPVRNHADAQYLIQQDRPKLQTFMECCFNNLQAPMHKAMLDIGATEIIRGQKLCDKQKSPVKDGDVIDGILYTFPIEDWTDEEVFEFVKDDELLSEHYKNAKTGLDCMHCTAYLDENQWKLTYLRENYPKVAKEVQKRLELIRNEVKRDMHYLDRILG